MRWDEYVLVVVGIIFRYVKSRKELFIKKYDWDIIYRFCMFFLVGGN